jgi:hypothetical protein
VSGAERRRGRNRASVVALLALGFVAGSTFAHAQQEQPPSPERIKSAAEEYDRGRRSFLAKEYEQAAVHFESAFRDAPRAETLRLAIRARREAKQLARAATLAAIAQQRYTSDPPTADLAKQTLDEAGPALQQYDVECTAECGVTADGRVVSQSDQVRQRIFLDPGPHDLGISFRSGSVARHVEAKKGGKESLAFEAPAVVTPPPTATVTATATATTTAPPPETPPASRKPLGPVVFFIGAGVTVAAGAATIVSGIDTKNNPGVDTVRSECAGKDETCPAYQDGRAAQLRTNILLGATIGVGLVTGVIGLFFTDWKGSPAKSSAASKVGLYPSRDGGSIGVSGSF